MTEDNKNEHVLQLLEMAGAVCSGAYKAFGENCAEWPAKALPCAAMLKLLDIILASEVSRWRTEGASSQPQLNLRPLHVLLDPKESEFLPLFKKICLNFPLLTPEEYDADLYEMLWGVGILSVQFLSQSTTDDGVEKCSDYKAFWSTTFDLVVNAETRAHPPTSQDELLKAYASLEALFARFSREDYVQQCNSTRRKLSPMLTCAQFSQIQSMLQEISKKCDQRDRPRRERSHITDRVISLMFKVSKNTPYNWRSGKAPAPKGFIEAYKAKDIKALDKCAAHFQEVRAAKKADAMNSKRLKRNLSDEEMRKNGATMPVGYKS